VTRVNGVAGDRDILRDELRRIGVVGINAADLSRSHDHHVRLDRANKIFCLLLAFKVDLVARSSDDFTCNACEPARQGGANHSAMARHINALADEIEKLGSDHGPFSAPVFSITSSMRNPMQRPSMGSILRSRCKSCCASLAPIRLQALNPPLSG